MNGHLPRRVTNFGVDIYSRMVKLCAAMIDLDTLLETLGGEAVVARSLGCGVSAISNWKVRGLPRGRKFDLLMLAKRHGIPLSAEDLEEASHVNGSAT